MYQLLVLLWTAAVALARGDLVAEHVEHIANAQPWRITTASPDDVYKHTSLDKHERVSSEAHIGWVDPSKRDGSMLDLVGNGFREPINVIISGRSDKSIMSDQGFLDYVRSIGFSFECLHIHLGGAQHANLGDGNGWVPQLYEYRELWFPHSPGVWLGSCWESLAGGNHFRGMHTSRQNTYTVWKQNGTHADTGAWFLATSKEEDVSQHHMIIPNGYDIGRDLLVEAACKGGTFKGKSWKASVEYRSGLLPEGRTSINHNISIDGRVAILTVRRTDVQ